MAKNKDPAVLFYTSDFLASTVLFSNEELGAYIKLLCIQHQQDGLHESEISTVGASERVREKFMLCDDGLYRNERMNREKQKRSAYSESRRENISKRYQATKNTTYVEDMKNICTSHELHMGNENENENINDNSNSINKEIKNTTTKSSETTQALYKRIRREYIYTAQLDAKVTEWLQYKSERREPYKETGLKVLLRKIENSALEYGETAVCDVIDESIANGWKGIIFDKLESVRSTPKQGGKAKTDKECSVPRYSTFDAEEAFEKALKKSYSQIKEST